MTKLDHWIITICFDEWREISTKIFVEINANAILKSYKLKQLSVHLYSIIFYIVLLCIMQAPSNIKMTSMYHLQIKFPTAQAVHFQKLNCSLQSHMFCKMGPKCSTVAKIIVNGYKLHGLRSKTYDIEDCILKILSLTIISHWQHLIALECKHYCLGWTEKYRNHYPFLTTLRKQLSPSPPFFFPKTSLLSAQTLAPHKRACSTQQNTCNDFAKFVLTIGEKSPWNSL